MEVILWNCRKALRNTIDFIMGKKLHVQNAVKVRMSLLVEIVKKRIVSYAISADQESILIKPLENFQWLLLFFEGEPLWPKMIIM